MTGGEEDTQHVPSRLQRLAIGERDDPVFGHRHDLAPERVHAVAVEPRGGTDQPRGIDQVRRADGMHEDLHVRLLAHDRPGAAGVIEMDVGDEDLGQLRGVESRRLDPGIERGESRGRSGLDQGQLVRSGQQVGVDDSVPALEPEIDGPDALVDLRRRAPGKRSLTPPPTHQTPGHPMNARHVRTAMIAFS